MTKILCDFCGGEVRASGFGYEITLGYKRTPSTMAGDHYDLCNDCKQDLLEWIMAKKKEREHE